MSLLIQVPLVGIFVWFTLRLNDTQQAAIARRDTEWREFLRSQQEAYNTGLGRIAEEVKAVTRQVALSQSMMVEHDSRLTEILPGIRDILADAQEERQTLIREARERGQK